MALGQGRIRSWSRGDPAPTSATLPGEESTVVVGSCRRRGGTIVVFSLVAAVILAGCSGPDRPPAASAPVTIGLLVPVTGSAANAALDAVRGTQLAADVVNHSYPELPIPFAAGTGLPGLGGRTLALVSGDTKGASDEAANQAEQVISNGAVAVV